MKRLILIFVVCFMFCSVDVFSANNRNYYVEKHIQYQLEDEEHNGYDLFDLICARYSDDKTPVALSGYHDGKLFATVPIESVDREIEVFLAYDIKFNDDLGYSADNQMFDMFEALYMRDILMPDKNGCVHPNAYITRGKVCNELVKFSGFIQNTTLVIPYKDVPVGDSLGTGQFLLHKIVNCTIIAPSPNCPK